MRGPVEEWELGRLEADFPDARIARADGGGYSARRRGKDPLTALSLIELRVMLTNELWEPRTGRNPSWPGPM